MMMKDNYLFWRGISEVADQKETTFRYMKVSLSGEREWDSKGDIEEMTETTELSDHIAIVMVYDPRYLNDEPDFEFERSQPKGRRIIINEYYNERTGKWRPEHMAYEGQTMIKMMVYKLRRYFTLKCDCGSTNLYFDEDSNVICRKCGNENQYYYNKLRE